jgi:hypothetical protein
MLGHDTEFSDSPLSTSVADVQDVPPLEVVSAYPEASTAAQELMLAHATDFNVLLLSMLEADVHELPL